jgi:hypothetical protein
MNPRSDITKVNSRDNRDKKNIITSSLLKEIFPKPVNSHPRNTIDSKKLNGKNLIIEERIIIEKEEESDSTKASNHQIDNDLENILNNEIKLKQISQNRNYTHENYFEEEGNDLNPSYSLNNPFDKNSNEIKVITNLKKKSDLSELELKYIKSGEYIRRDYMAKLIYKKVWKPNIKEKDHNTLIIFDWDDTLLCTSFLTPNGIFSEDICITERDFEKLKKLENCAANILLQALNKGDTYIITNAAPGWVEYSANKFYPEVAKLLNKVKIVSARGDYEKKYPGDSRQWKIQAFLEMLKSINSNLVTNLICLGDSIIEMEAAHILASKFSQAYIKTIKFREAPKPDELIKQLNLVIEQFDKIYSSVKNLTIRVEKKPKQDNSAI